MGSLLDEEILIKSLHLHGAGDRRGKPLLEHRASSSKQMRAKLAVVENLLDMLSGSGGDSSILLFIETLDSDGDGNDNT